MERPIFKPIGTAAGELDTPAFVVDLDALEHNIEAVHSYFRPRTAKVRPHIESHRCPAIAHKQLGAGGAVGGISVNTVGQAELFATQGFADILIASEIVTPLKISKLCALAHHAKIAVAIDSPKNVQDLSEAASANGVTIHGVVDINTRLNRCGVEPGQAAVDLASILARAPGLHFAGFMTYEGTILSEDLDELARETRKVVQQVLDTKEMAEKAGLEVGIVSAGGTHNYEIVGDMDGITEVPAGSYALMDYRYAGRRPELRTAARVLATVSSRPEPGVAILDTGQKSIGADSGLPGVDGDLDATVDSLSAEHGTLKLSREADSGLGVGDKVWLIPRDIGTCANLYDYIHAVRNGKLETTWDISARGLYR